MARMKYTERKVLESDDDDSSASEGDSMVISESEEEFVPEYIIDDEDLIVGGTKFDEIDFVKRDIQYYPPRKWPVQIHDNLRDFIKSLYPTTNLEGDMVHEICGCGNSKLYYVTLSQNPTFTCKVWEGEARQLVHVIDFPLGTSQNDMYLALKRYVDDNYKLEIVDTTVGIQEGMNDFVESIKHIYGRMVQGKGSFRKIKHIYRLSLGEHEGFVYHMWIAVILVGVAKPKKFVGVCVLESTWIQTIDCDKESSIHPTREALEEIMFDQLKGTPTTCADCREAHTLYLNKVDLQTFPIVSLAWFAVAHHNILKVSQHLQFVDVLMAAFQQVSGHIVKLVFSAKDDENNVKIYWTEALMIPWLRVFRLTPLAQV